MEQACAAVVEGAAHRGNAVNAGKVHWVVTLNRRNRSLFFALGLFVLGTHLAYLQAGPLMWTLLALQLLVYPQLVYWRAARSPDPLRAELQNLLIDGVLLGAWIAVMGLPLWISFVLFVGVCLNVVIFMGMPGLWKGVASLAAGAAAVAAVHGLEFRPHTELHTSLLCIVLLTAYLLFFANAAYRRGVKLRDSRRELGERLEQITALQSQLQEQAQRDPLTGLHNRRFLDEALERELAQCMQSGLPLTLVLIDIDRFKRINDTYGHQAGDTILRRVAAALASVTRKGMDFPCRYGGDEFAVVTTEIEAEALQRLAMRIRNTVVESCRNAIDLSMGLAMLKPEDTIESFVARTDRASYRAKNQPGGDRLQWAECPRRAIAFRRVCPYGDRTPQPTPAFSGDRNATAY